MGPNAAADGLTALGFAGLDDKRTGTHHAAEMLPLMLSSLMLCHAACGYMVCHAVHTHALSCDVMPCMAGLLLPCGVSSCNTAILLCCSAWSCNVMRCAALLCCAHTMLPFAAQRSPWCCDVQCLTLLCYVLSILVSPMTSGSCMCCKQARWWSLSSVC